MISKSLDLDLKVKLEEGPDTTAIAEKLPNENLDAVMYGNGTETTQSSLSYETCVEL